MAKTSKPKLALNYDNEQVDRWMVSYADFVTLLFILFLALYTLVPRDVHEQLLGKFVKKTPVTEPIVSIVESPPPKVREIDLIKVRLIQYLAKQGLSSQIKVSASEHRVTLDLPDYLLFAPGTADLSASSLELIDGLAQVLDSLSAQARITVEGHTDSIPIQTATFPSNWELSSARAAIVVRRLEARGIARDRLLASGRADAAPRGDNATPEGRAENRRVTFYVDTVK